MADGGIDHEDGIDSVQVEKQMVVRPKGQYLGGVPLVAWVQAQKDKNQFAFQGEREAQGAGGRVEAGGRGGVEVQRAGCARWLAVVLTTHSPSPPFRPPPRR